MHPSLSIPPRTLRIAAAAIACTAVCILVALSHHPTVGAAANAQEIHAQMVRLGARDNLVHGALAAMLAVMAGALAVFDGAFGLPRPFSAGARGLYLLGCVLLGVAMLFDGFFLPALAGEFLHAGPAAADVVQVIMRAAGILVQQFSKAGLVCHGAAMLAWSYAAVAHRSVMPGWRWCAVLGAAAGLLPAAGMLFGGVVLTPHSLILLFTVYAAWYLAAAASMFRYAAEQG
jgi:hypothetical protein